MKKPLRMFFQEVYMITNSTKNALAMPQQRFVIAWSRS
jgi:hypothetical protein